jgi:hypothetical protein
VLSPCLTRSTSLFFCCDPHPPPPSHPQIQDFSASLIQSVWRMYVCKADFGMYRSAASLIQALWRGKRCRVTVEMMQARTTALRMLLKCTPCRAGGEFVLPLPMLLEGLEVLFLRLFGANVVLLVVEQKACLRLQAWGRMFIVKRSYQHRRSAVIRIQAALRGLVARRQLALGHFAARYAARSQSVCSLVLVCKRQFVRKCAGRRCTVLCTFFVGRIVQAVWRGNLSRRHITGLLEVTVMSGVGLPVPLFRKINPYVVVDLLDSDMQVGPCHVLAAPRQNAKKGCRCRAPAPLVSCTSLMCCAPLPCAPPHECFQNLAEGRTDAVRKCGKAPTWRGKPGGAEEKDDSEAGGAAANGLVVLPFSRRAGSALLLALHVWDEDSTKATVDEFLGEACFRGGSGGAGQCAHFRCGRRCARSCRGWSFLGPVLHSA